RPERRRALREGECLAADRCGSAGAQYLEGGNADGNVYRGPANVGRSDGSVLPPLGLQSTYAPSKKTIETFKHAFGLYPCYLSFWCHQELPKKVIPLFLKEVEGI